MKIIHVTDPHLVAPGQTLCGTDPAERLGRCLDDIARWHPDAEFCVLSGDLTDNGAPEAYAWLRDRLGAFPIRTFPMLGNHDERAAFRAVFPEVGGDYVQQAHQTEAGLFLTLDTLDQGEVGGRLCADRLGWLGARLAEAGGRPVYIFMHHPPCNVGMPLLDQIKLAEPEAFAAALAGHDIRHIFFGHLHRPCYVNWRGIPCTALPGTNHQVPLVDGSVAGPHCHEPAMYGVVLIEEAQVTVHLDAFLDRRPVADG